MELGSSIKLLCHRSPSAQLSDGLRAAAQCHLAPMCTYTLPAMLADLPIPWQHHHQLGSFVEVFRWHPQFSIHLGGAIEASCRCAASYCRATASYGRATSCRLLSCHRSPPLRLSDNLRAAAMHAGSWLWTCRGFHQCHLEALKRPTDLKHWILQKITSGMALMKHEHTKISRLGFSIKLCHSSLLAHLSNGLRTAAQHAGTGGTMTYARSTASFEKAQQFEALDPSKDCLNFSVAAWSSHTQASLLNSHQVLFNSH